MFGVARELCDFMMIDRHGVAEVVALARSKALQPRDYAVLMALISGWTHTDNSTTGSSAELAAQLGANRDDVIRSLARLRRAGLLVRWKAGRERRNRSILSPSFITAGGRLRRLEHLDRFHAQLR